VRLALLVVAPLTLRALLLAAPAQTTADSAAVSTASASWPRELAALKEPVSPSSRARVTEDLSRLDADVREYADLLVKALEAAQEKNSIMGEATTLRAKAQPRRELMKLPEETLELAPRCAEALR
jgi:hypothetical protein